MLMRLLMFELKHHFKNIYQYIYIYAFYLVSAAVYFFALPINEEHIYAASALLWVNAMLGALLLGGGSFDSDLKLGYLEQLRLSGVQLEGYIFSKIAIFTVLGGAPLLLLVAAVQQYASDPAMFAHYYVILPFASFIAISVVVLTAAIVAGINQAGFILGIISLPWLIPIIVFGSDAVTAESLWAQPAFWVLVGLAGFMLPAALLFGAAALKK